jgi:hypothetical protein
MNTTRISALSFMLSAIVLCTPAQAIFRAYLASTGNDANPCTLPAPCRLLPRALTAVDSGGEIWLLDSANFNSATVSVAKSVTILAIPGAVGSVVATGGPAMSITGDGVRVTLRNLVVVPLPGGGGTNGVEVATTGASRISIERTQLSGLAGTGISVNAPADVRISDVEIRDVAVPISLSGSALASVARLTCSGGSDYCVYLPGGTATVSVTDSVMTSGWGGIGCFGGTNAIRAHVTRSTISDMTWGLFVFGSTCYFTVSATTITQSNTGIAQGSAAVVETAGNNSVRQNATNTSGTITSVGTQ